MIGKQLTPRYKLENDPMCGFPTGGREECFWDCEIDHSLPFGRPTPIISNPKCLLDCFPEVDNSKLMTIMKISIDFI